MEQQFTYEQLDRLHEALKLDFVAVKMERDALRRRLKETEHRAIAIRLQAERKMRLTRWTAIVVGSGAFLLGLVIR